MEEWRAVLGYEGIYQISSIGRVKNAYGHILKPETSRNGYKRVTFYDRKKFQIHRLVASAFIPNPKGKDVVNHKNGDKLDNSVENLEWNTWSENSKHAYDIGLRNVTDECRQQISLAQRGNQNVKGLIWITDGRKIKGVRPEYLDEYLRQGYTRGRKIKNEVDNKMEGDAV